MIAGENPQITFFDAHVGINSCFLHDEIGTIKFHERTTIILAFNPGREYGGNRS